MSMPRALVLTFAAIILSLSLTACGKRGSPEAPPGEKGLYPRAYPSVEQPGSNDDHH